MDTQYTTGLVANVLGVTEPRLNDLLRRQKVSPTPLVRSGRRFWTPEHILQAAQHLGLDLDVIRKCLKEIEGAASAKGKVV